MSEKLEQKGKNKTVEIEKYKFKPGKEERKIQGLASRRICKSFTSRWF
jgi:hypothetical protein